MDDRERIVRLEERLSAMANVVDELRHDVSTLRERDAIARAIARSASARPARWFALGGLALTALNIAVAFWIGTQ